MFAAVRGAAVVVAVFCVDAVAEVVARAGSGSAAVTGGEVAAAIFSRLFVFAATGLCGCGESISASLLVGDAALDPVLLSPPAWESADGLLAGSGFRKPLTGVRPLADRVCDMLPLLRCAAEEAGVCRAVLDAGAAGGPIDVRCAGMDVRWRAPVDATRVFEGVPVLDAAALDVALEGFEGDFDGDCKVESC